uniref:Cleavage induced serine protease family S33 putative n=1 Tax=Albugo laibachii Nc14 TaxID=890382 RepID=F0X0T8_9STRA|nr:cleavage induced serine protease family S33 putative [Albugo laibachii Nc14]|eukprot:CCA27382.1 cleavage induced serine protease family S33 putative [Albugo laibachii Nc14]
MRLFLKGSSAALVLGFATTKGRYWDWVPATYEQLEKAEKRILQRNIRVPFEVTKVARLGTVFIPCTGNNSKAEAVKDLVLVHGFAGGNALWAANVEELAKFFNVYAVEWIGVGRSDRPEFKHTTYDDADIFIVETFEKWRMEMNLHKFCLCAHSMGAIFGTSYAIQHPQRVERLVLVSPAGVPRPPPFEERKKKIESRLIYRVADFAWRNGVTPMTITRAAGPYGPKLVQRILKCRISWMPPNSTMRNGAIEIQELADYMYQNWALKASGERLIATHLAPGALAVRPLIDELTPEKIGMPITFVYGESDWMDYRHTLEIIEKLQAHGISASLYRVKDSGHLPFLDNPREFNRVVIEALL